MSSGVVEQRRGIGQGYVELEWSIDQFHAPDYPWQSKKTVVKCWFAEGQRRFDMQVISVTKDGQEATSDSQVIFDNEGGFMLRPNQDEHAVEISSADADNFTYVEDYDWDIRCLGLAPVSLQRLTEYGLDDVFQMLTRGEVVATTTAEGLIEFSSAFESLDEKEVHSLWRVDPSQGDTVVHASVTRPDFSYTLQVQNREWHAGVWFPESIRFEQTMEGQLYYQESVTVSAADFLSSVDPGVFEFSALELHPGRSVRDHGEYREWDGTQLVEHPEFKVSPPSVEMPAPSSRLPVLLAANVLIFGIAASYFFVRYLRNRSQQS